jgi:hypothetical protein
MLQIGSLRKGYFQKIEEGNNAATGQRKNRFGLTSPMPDRVRYRSYGYKGWGFKGLALVPPLIFKWDLWYQCPTLWVIYMLRL